jgi:hypothetical protein
MFRLQILSVLICFSIHLLSQNDIDAIRFSRSGVGGSGRFMAMGGAFGAVGADLSCAGFNPAGLGVFRKGEISFSGSLRLNNNKTNIYNTNSSVSDVLFAFNNFGIAYAWPSSSDPKSRNVIAFNNSQNQNFSRTVMMGGYTNNSSIAKDMNNLADQKGSPENLNGAYEDLGYETYLLDYDGSRFISLVDPKRTVYQSRQLATLGRLNELNFSYAYSYQDKFYFGASIGVPRVDYASTTTHFESDDKDSMRIVFTSPSTFTSTYVDGLSSLDTNYQYRLGFNNLTYTEYFKTQGSGVNLKLGGIIRLNQFVRVGFYFHTPTVYYLNDTYYNTISTSFDKNPNSPDQYKNPEKNDGYFEYKIITPSRLSLSSAFIIQKIALFAVDYEYVNYPSAKLSSANASDFAGVNSVIKNKYRGGHNLRIGGELNIKPIMFRAGYNMQGSPFGDVFAGNFVRQTISFGLGFRSQSNWYLDLMWCKSFSTENYYLFNTLNTQSKINYNVTSLGATIGIKF